jgi:hypothetical protein
VTKAVDIKGRVGHLTKRRRYSVYFISIGVWLTGAVWLIFHYFIRQTDQFGFENSHPGEKWALIGHAAFAFYAMWLFGVLWPAHVKRSWNAVVRRGSGGTLFGVTAWLSLTGLALYYIGSDFWRELTSWGHWLVGLAGLVVFLIHLLTRTPRSHRHHPPE